VPRPPFYPFRSDRARAEFEAHCREWASAWPVPSDARTLETPSGRTFVRVSGSATDPPLVLLPGTRVGSLMWMSTVAALSARHRTYALDVIDDVGLSVSHARVSTYADLVRWLDEALDQLAPEGPVSLLGVSYGGAIAAQYALRFPGRLRRLALLAPGATVLPFSFSFIVRTMLLCLPRPGADRDPLRRMLLWIFRDAARGDTACRARLEEAIAHTQLAVRSFALPVPPWPRVLSDSEWQGLRVPCLFLVGENERIYSPDAALRRLKRVAPGVKTAVIPGAGHDMTLVHPDRVTQIVLDFLAA
jgi:pimeloyl-ACP methyl ester carboxylesterase